MSAPAANPIAADARRERPIAASAAVPAFAPPATKASTIDASQPCPLGASIISAPSAIAHAPFTAQIATRMRCVPVPAASPSLP